MGGFLLLPQDELTLVAHLVEHEGLVRLAHEDLAHGPQLAGPLRAPVPLPEPGADPERFTFWASEVGELQGAPFVDHARSPIVVWHRSRWHASGALCPGRLSSQARRRVEQPPALPVLYDRVHQWMKREATKLHGVRAFPHAAVWVRDGGPVRAG